MKTEFLLCGSATDAFFSQMAFFRLSLDNLGGIYRDARVVAVFGDHEVEEIPARWQPYFENIDVRWAHEPGAPNPWHRAQHELRFEILDPDCDVSFLCDADVAVLRPFDSLLASIRARPCVAGVVAHLHFPWDERPRDPDRDWPEIANAVIGKEIDRPYRYTLLPEETPPAAPFYINYGVFAGTPDMLSRFHERDLEICPKVEAHLGAWWAPQVSLALTCADLDLPTMALPMRYNFANDRRADAMYPEELQQVVFLHYLRQQHFQRGQLFASRQAFDTFLSLELEGSDEVFRQAVARMTGGEFPFA